MLVFIEKFYQIFIEQILFVDILQSLIIYKFLIKKYWRITCQQDNFSLKQSLLQLP